MGNCHFKPDFDAENFTGKLAINNSSPPKLALL